MFRRTPILFLSPVLLATSLTLFASTIAFGQSSPDRLRVLFLGDNGHHQPAKRFLQIQPYMSARGIQIVYSDHPEDMNAETLSRYHVLMLYGNISSITSEQEAALFDFIQSGGGLVPVHAGIAMFANSDAYSSLVGATFKSHGHGVFTTRFLRPEHPVLRDLTPFESWDETYIHMRHNPDKIVLTVQEENGYEEPWTWVRSQGEGRVFYTAWGHDERTWSNPGFHKLIEQGIRWAAGNWALTSDWAPPTLTYTEGKVPFYPAGQGWGVTGDPITEIQEPLSPEASLEQAFIEPGFRVELFAAEPDIVNPIDMDWDERGRLWVVETIDYPNTFNPSRKGNDRIKIMEDTDGDGRADLFTVFADSLNIPTSIVLANGGVIVSQAPDMLFLKDTDGDDRADVKEVLFTGWGTFDTHAGPNNLRYGLDNHIWGAVGYSGFNGSLNSDSLRFGQALYRFAPDGSSMEHMATFNNNTWGLGINEEGIIFGSTANRNPSVHAAIPERFYARIEEGTPHVLGTIADDASFYPVTDRVRQVDQHGLYTSGAGYELYTARSFPESYWNRVAFIGGPTGHLLGKFAHEPEGSSYIAYNEGNMIASRDEWFSPIQSRVGPDGALWFIDWYNLIIQHNPTPDGYETGEGNAYEIGLRDQTHSRIYRLVYDEAPPSSSYDLTSATDTEIIEALSSNNMLWRTMAQRLIVEQRKIELIPQILPLIQDERIDEIGLNTSAIHAIWTLHGLGALNSSNSEALKTVEDALYHPSAGVRRAALMTLPLNDRLLNLILRAGILPDPQVPENMDYTVNMALMDAHNAQIRLAALLAIADLPYSEKAGLVVAHTISTPQNANDTHIRTAAAAAAVQHGFSFLRHALQMQIPAESDTSFVSNVNWVIEAAAKRYAATGASQGLYELLSKLQDTQEVISIPFLETLAAHWPDNSTPEWSANERTELTRIAASLSQTVADAFKELAEKWGQADLILRSQ